jgi:hypothetical protein
MDEATQIIRPQPGAVIVTAGACLNQTQQICTSDEGPIHGGFPCANVMNEMESGNDRGICAGEYG